MPRTQKHRLKPRPFPSGNTGRLVSPQASIWSDLPLTTGIAALVCYAGVFNDVIGVAEMASRLGVSGQRHFYAALNELHAQGKLILKGGFVALPNLEDKIAIKTSKIAMARDLINSRLARLLRLGRNPLVRFVGISGSLAANNPTKDRNNHLDIDVFLITRNQCLWFYNILRGIRNLFPQNKRKLQLCINYVIDESNLLIGNRNFYTATEIRNMIPVSGMDVYRKFLQVNNWVNYYYPGFSGVSGTVASAASGNVINKFFYVLYTMLRSIKWFSLNPLRNLSFKADPHLGIGFNQLSQPCGGYQAWVQNKFGRLAETWFPDWVDAALVEKLFPDELSSEIRSVAFDVPKIIVDARLRPDYLKYG